MILMESRFLPTQKFSNVEDELKYLRAKVAEREGHFADAGVVRNLEGPAREIIAEYKTIAPKQVLHESFALPAEEHERLVKNLEPEEHDRKMEELVRLTQERGVKNALEVVEKLGNYHLTDDFHRFLSEYIREGNEVQGANRESKDRLSKSLNMALFEISIPETGQEEQNRAKTLKEVISSMEQFYAGMLSVSDKESGDNFVSVEIANRNGSNETVFYVAVPAQKKNLLEQQLLSVFHNAKIQNLPGDYNIFNETGAAVGSVAELKKSPAYPLKTYELFDHDPLNVILNGFSKVNRDGEGASIQLLWRPAGDTYIKNYNHATEKLERGTPAKEALDIPDSLSAGVFKEFRNILVGSSAKKTEDKKDETKKIDQLAIDEVRKKTTSPIVVCNLRILASAPTEEEATEILGSLESSFNQFQSTTGNELKWKRYNNKKLGPLARNFSFRILDDSARLPLNLSELTTLIHFHTTAIKSPELLRQSHYATAAAPPESSNGILLGMNKNRNIETEVRMNEEDRLRHFYTIGQTGTGKSTLLKNMIVQDIERGNGVCMIDPHGNDIADVLGCVPPERYQDVIYFDPAYTQKPMALNMLEYDPAYPEQKTFVVNELFSIFRKLYGNVPEAMGPAFEQYFRNSALLVMEDPESGNTLVDVSRVLSNKAYRQLKISRCKNPLVSQFWTNAEKTTGDQGLANYVQYVTNKFDVFLANDIMRPVVAQEHSTFNFRDIMDNKKILLVNLSKGRLGDINANLIGLILVGKILMAALSRVELFSQGKDFPPFYLYIDEFQNITTDSISTILSEARKYKLSLNIAHQYIKQLDENIANAVFGNVGTICSFRVGADDAELLAKQFEPTFSASDLMNIDNHNAYLKPLVGGKPVKPFNITVLPPQKGESQKIDLLKNMSYEKFGRDRAEVENIILQKYKTD